MKINTTSWHYRFVSFFDPDIDFYIRKGRVTTCDYVNKIIRNIIMSIVFACVILFFAACWGWISVVAPFLLIFTDVDIVGKYSVADAAFAGGFFWTVGATFVVCRFVYKRYNHRFYEFLESSKQTPSLFTQYIRDKKEKVCTICTLETTDKE